ncbi:hypothetical protein M231_02725 [Tremella mesenterica]|uniref:Uncharacterized protein n=1 Tax=Tremella mesenterica TaxID=5217 RepID=A0A4Q1BQ05_TREME|nr:uncharacterized protein TREMEDRAFT_71555 [Tremella mesenterica DSM 1558]EIW70222.1 hypothetical protein TREMEDRAFT_71555 [Tremella mesenterica DSM 1558]RXK39930.1 hypothetical protein M231_02725 [Tremella mesenterica]
MPGKDTITSSGQNSQGNSYDTRVDSGGNSGYHYSNSNGSYYYSNTNGSSYYNTGNGYASYTSPQGQSTQYYGSAAKK